MGGTPPRRIMEMLVSHADTNDDAALNASEVEALVAMLSTGGGH